MEKHADSGATDTEPRYVVGQALVDVVKDHFGIDGWTELGDFVESAMTFGKMIVEGFSRGGYFAAMMDLHSADSERKWQLALRKARATFAEPFESLSISSGLCLE